MKGYCVMKKHISDIFFSCFALIILIVLFLMPACFNSSLVHAAKGDFEASTTNTVYFVNPLYKNVISESQLKHLDDSGVSSEQILSADTKYTSIAEIATVLRNELRQRKSNITIYYSFAGESYTARTLINMESDAITQAMVHTGNGKEGDYLSWGYSGYGMQVTHGTRDGRTEGAFIYCFSYYTTPEQEAAVDSKAASLSSSLGLSSKTQYEKVLAVYKYICDNVTYSKDSGTLKYSCYAAMCKNSAVCQGYALMAYRLLNDSGVDCRLIAGDTSGGGHGWNIVKIGSGYYNFDVTWDAGKTPENYLYFLKCDANFSDHKRWSQYKSADFYAQYPMSSSDYDTGTVGSRGKIKGIKISTEKLVLKVGDDKKLSASYVPTGTTAKNVHWSTNNKKVATASNNGTVTAQKQGTCVITVKTDDGKYSKKCYVTVKAGKKVAVKKIKLNKKKVKLEKGKKFELKVTFSPKNATNKNVKYSSSNKSIAKVNKKGVITARKKGTCTITVTSKDGKKVAKCKVIVN